jgi:predicted transcriptional regulator of viral defense system
MPASHRPASEETGSRPPRGDQIRSPQADAVIGKLAARQHGVVARRQLLAVGVTRKAVEVRLKRGRLLLVHPGVYAVGHRQLRREGYWMAAVLGAGDGAALSHRDAAALHGMLRPGAHRGVDVTTTAEAGRRAGINVHGTTVLDAEDVTTVDGIPTTTVARTFVDLAGTVPKDRLRKAMNEAERRNLLDVRALERALAKTAGRRGSGHRALREALRELATMGVHLTRSELEDRFLSLVVEPYGLPRPAMNAPIAGMEVDAVWRRQRVAVELDGWGPHSTRRAFQEDRERDVRLHVTGYRVVRFTYADVTGRPAWVAQAIGELLAPAPSAARATMSAPACP